MGNLWPERESVVKRAVWLCLAVVACGAGCDAIEAKLNPPPARVTAVPETPPEPPPAPPPVVPQGPVPLPDVVMSLAAWDAATPGEREAAAIAVGERMRTAEFARLETFASGGQQRDVAVFVHQRTGVEFSLVPAGSFEMGSPGGEEGRNNDETRRRVTLTQPFLIARTEITQAVWEDVMGKNTSRNLGEQLPAENIGLSAIQRFLFRTRLTLPTEAQWEYACRAGTDTRFYFGDDAAQLGEHAWYEANSGGTSHPVASKKPNAFGLFDMHGNVWEWCLDGYAPLGPDGTTDPVGPDDASDRVTRGGSWGNMVPVQRCAFRMRMHPGDLHGGLGFRPIEVVGAN